MFPCERKPPTLKNDQIFRSKHATYIYLLLKHLGFRCKIIFLNSFCAFLSFLRSTWWSRLTCCTPESIIEHRQHPAPSPSPIIDSKRAFIQKNEKKKKKQSSPVTAETRCFLQKRSCHSSSSRSSPDAVRARVSPRYLAIPPSGCSSLLFVRMHLMEGGAEYPPFLSQLQVSNLFKPQPRGAFCVAPARAHSGMSPAWKSRSGL